MRVAIYVQHLLGTGHLVRARLIADAMDAAGHEVLLVSGGKLDQPPGYKHLQLPVLKTNPGDFLTLLDHLGNPVSQSWKQVRCEQLVDAVAGFAPDVVMLETWPFGRRQMEFEIFPLLESISRLPTRPMVISSIRDVLQHRKEKRRLETLRNVERWIDLVLVHGEKTVTPLADSFSEASELACPVEYSGYITRVTDDKIPAAVERSEQTTGEVIVSAGGGAVGLELLKVSLNAAVTDSRLWRILSGPKMPESDFMDLRQRATKNVCVERNRSDFQQLLQHCEVSISQFGYNTALDLLSAGCPAVVVPYAEDGETEQSQRAECFGKRHLVVSLAQDILTPESLLDAINRATMNSSRPDHQLLSDGAARSVDIVEQLLRNREKNGNRPD